MKLCPWDTRAVVLSSTVTLQSKDSLLQKKELMQSLKKGLISWSEERYGYIKLHYCFKVHTALCFNSSFMQILFFFFNLFTDTSLHTFPLTPSSLSLFRECPKISHRQFYQSLVHESESEKTLPLQIRVSIIMCILTSIYRLYMYIM